MQLKNHLIEVFKQASSENNFLLQENVVIKWVHRFGINSLNDLLIHSQVQKDNQHEEENEEQISLINEEYEEENEEQISLINEEYEEENEEQISLINEEHEEENEEQIRLESLKTSENLEEIQCESNYLEISIDNEALNTNKDINQINQYTKSPKLPLPYIKNLRKWINKDKKAS